MIITRWNLFIIGLFATILVFSLSGCADLQPKVNNQPDQATAAPPEEESAPGPADQHISAAERLMGKGDFEASLKEDQKVLAIAGKESPGDRALYNMGLIYVHYKNPNKNYAKAKSVFDRLAREYPDSPLLEEAKIWAGVLQVIEKLQQVDIEIEKKKKELSK
jgi:TolA-binding protein